ATAEGNLKDQAEHVLNAQQARLSLSMTGPKVKYVGRPAEFEIRVGNPGDVPVANVVVRHKLPPVLSFVSAGQGGQAADGEVVWNLGTLQPREQRALQLTTRCEKLTPAAVNVAVATADPGLKAEAEARVEILGIPALRLEVIDIGDPVEVGKQVTYVIEVTNTGSLAGKDIELKATVPIELRAVDAKGPTKEKIDGPLVSFAPVPTLEPGKKLTYTIQ